MNTLQSDHPFSQSKCGPVVVGPYGTLNFTHVPMIYFTTDLHCLCWKLADILYNKDILATLDKNSAEQAKFCLIIRCSLVWEAWKIPFSRYFWIMCDIAYFCWPWCNMPASMHMHNMHPISLHRMPVHSVKCYPGGRITHFIPSISNILSQKCYHYVQYTRRHLMSLI